jgi:hypothetical protein
VIALCIRQPLRPVTYTVPPAQRTLAAIEDLSAWNARVAQLSTSDQIASHNGSDSQ